jgi:hypothetical protein
MFGMISGSEYNLAINRNAYGESRRPEEEGFD